MIERFRNELVVLLKVNNSTLVPSIIVMSTNVIITPKITPENFSRNYPRNLNRNRKSSQKIEPKGIRDWGYFIGRCWPAGRTARRNKSTVPARTRFDIVNNEIIPSWDSQQTSQYLQKSRVLHSKNWASKMENLSAKKMHEIFDRRKVFCGFHMENSLLILIWTRPSLVPKSLF